MDGTTVELAVNSVGSVSTVEWKEKRWVSGIFMHVNEKLDENHHCAPGVMWAEYRDSNGNLQNFTQNNDTDTDSPIAFKAPNNEGLVYGFNPINKTVSWAPALTNYTRLVYRNGTGNNECRFYGVGWLKANFSTSGGHVVSFNGSPASSFFTFNLLKNDSVEVGSAVVYNVSCDGGSTFTGNVSDDVSTSCSAEGSNLMNRVELRTNNFNVTPSLYSFRVNVGIANISEDSARLAIEQAANATLTNPVIYTDRQVYARNRTNAQDFGRLDKLIISGNKRWAVNFKTGSDVYTNMFNITPVFYVYETESKTPNQLRLAVEQMINATK